MATCKLKHEEEHYAILGVKGDQLELRNPKALGNSKLVDIEKFKETFASFTLCYYSENAILSHKSIPKQLACKSALVRYQMTVDSPGEYYVSWHQPDKRCVFGLGSGGSMFVTEKITMMVASEDGFYLGEAAGVQRDTSVKVKLENGKKYIVFVRGFLIF